MIKTVILTFIIKVATFKQGCMAFQVLCSDTFGTFFTSAGLPDAILCISFKQIYLLNMAND